LHNVLIKKRQTVNELIQFSLTPSPLPLGEAEAVASWLVPNLLCHCPFHCAIATLLAQRKIAPCQKYFQIALCFLGFKKFRPTALALLKRFQTVPQRS
jgi:hypothetical protein